MRLSKNFLNSFIDLKDVDYHNLANKLLLLGNEYDSIFKLAYGSNLKVGYVIDCYPHPDSDHLSVCLVDLGDEKTQIVCGAPNVRKDIKVIVACDGAVLKDDFKIKKTTIRGEESNGMICSLSEVGIEEKYQSEEDKTGIHILSDDAKVGDDPLKYLELDDEVIDFELTYDRFDLQSIIGFSYEANIILDKKINFPELKVNKEIEDINDYLKLKVESENVPLYLLRLVKDVEIKESPNFIKGRLIASGIRPINNVVDISNYVMLEYGQPLHFFDYDKLDKNIIIREGKKGEVITTLDKVKRELDDGDILITSNNHPVCLAGIMGSLDSEVEKTSKNIMIESAIFNPDNIKKTSKRLLKSEASIRFEKEKNYEYTYDAINRAVYLLEKYANAKVIKGTLVHDKVNKEKRIVNIELDFINKILDLELSNKEVSDIFRRLDFNFNLKDNLYEVEIPNRRLDINIKEDLIEEIIRVYGLDKLKKTTPLLRNNGAYVEEKLKRSRMLRDHLLSLGFNEVINYTLVNEEEINKFTNNNYERLNVKDPMSDDKKFLRTSLIPSLIRNMDYNINRKHINLMLCELSNIYYKDHEKLLLSGLICGKREISLWQNNNQDFDFFDIKGIVEELLKYLGLNNRYKFLNDNLPKDFNPYQSARVLVDQKEVGYLGMIHPKESKNKAFAFELDLDILLSIRSGRIKDKEISLYPSIEKDLAFIIKNDVSAQYIENIIRREGGRLLKDIIIFDLYKGDNIPKDSKSIAYKLIFRDDSKTLRDEEVMEIFNKIIKKVEDNGGILRDK